MKKQLLIMALAAITTTSVTAQVAVNTDGTNADPSAILDVKSTNKGMLVPRMTMAQRDAISAPATGLMIFQTDNSPGFYYYDGAAWATATGASSINDLTDGKAYSTSVFVGASSGATATGTKNTAIGFGSLNKASGYENIGLGFQAGKDITTGNLNIMIGADVNGIKPSAPTASNELNIANSIFATGLYNKNPIPNPNPNTEVKVGIGYNHNSPQSTLDVNGSLSLPIALILNNYTITDTNYTIVAANVTITLPPTSSTGLGRIYVIKAGASGCTLSTSAGDNVDGNTTITLAAREFIEVQNLGSNSWVIIGTNQ